MAVGALAMVALAASWACGSDGSPSASVPTPRPTPTPFEASRVDFERATGAFDSYTIEVPAGWTVEDTRFAGGFGQEFVLNHEGTRVAAIMVLCRVGATIESMMDQDQKVVHGLHGNYIKASAVQVVVAGTAARQLDYNVGLAGIPVNYRSVYLAREPCGWRLTLATFGAGLFDQYLPVFERAIASFEPKSFEVPFSDRDPFSGAATQE